jgi:hypothetical protein
MARQEDICWRCGTPWAAEEQPPVALRAISRAAPEEALLQTERWVDEGGSFKRAI